jgi:glycosyltransferase involved in cell wall biosynthesis
MKPTRPHVQIYIMSYNRPEYIEQTLESVLAQDYPNFEVIVSDNSTHDKVEEFLSRSKLSGRFKYIKRRPSLSVLDHANQIIEEVTSDYFMMFHDDDVMTPTMVTKLMRFILSQHRLAAVGCNAYLLNGNKATNKRFNPYLTQDITIDNPTTLTQHYMISKLGHIPFPSYLYRTASVKSLRMLWKKGQKHADVVYLLEMTKSGAIGWLKDCAMYYRRHGANGSHNADPRAIVSLCRYVNHNVPISEKIVHDFKHKHFLLWIKQKRQNEKLSLSPWRDRVIFKSANKFALTHANLVIKYLMRNLLSPQS